MKIAIAQINPHVGAIQKNQAKIIDHISQAKAKGADLVVFPELAITGYPPEDLLLKPKFIKDNLAALNTIVDASKGIGVYIGFVDKAGKSLFNAGAFIDNGKIKAVYHKMNLPNYSVFDEKRYFKEGDKPVVVAFKDVKLKLSICEDMWVDMKAGSKAKTKAGQKAEIEIVINASPYHIEKQGIREKVAGARAKKTKAHIIYVNTVGGQDELVFDGASFAVNSKGQVIARAPQFKEALIIIEQKGEIIPKLGKMEEIYDALKLGIKDYVAKNGFSEVLIGLSGGVDSAITLTLAADALGAKKVHPVFMPSEFTSGQSADDSRALCRNLGIDLKIIPIQEVFTTYKHVLIPFFKGRSSDITEENLQARIRGNYLMALSNKFGYLVLTTGNKSEISTGYSTLYGDMAGGFCVLKDVPKTLVYKLTDWRNKNKVIIPKAIIDRAPTAELRPNQKDQDTLPQYDVLDKIIEAYVEDNKSVLEIINMGIDKVEVDKTIRLIDMSEYKRRQSPPGPRITERAFGKDWRLPITNGYKEY